MTLSSGRESLIVKPTSLRVAAWVSILFSIFATIGASSAGAYKPAVIFLVFVGLGAYMLLAPGNLEMDAKLIVYRTPLASYEIRWDEVTRIEIDRVGSNIVFWGENKRLVAVGPYLWEGADRKQMLVLIASQIDNLGITVQQSEKAGFRLSKNTKLRP